MENLAVDNLGWRDCGLADAGRASLDFIECFKVSVQLYPDRTAVVCQDEKLSYLELYNRAQRLAARLQQLGVGPETIVGICLERSPEYLVSLLATWLAGAAFLPIDPSYPDERIAFITADAALRFCITRSRYAGLFSQADVELIDPDAQEDPGRWFAPIKFDPERLAYLIYTSGSSGLPKGVLVTHRGITSFLRAQVQAFHLKPTSRVLFYLSQGFDASISDIGTALLAGAALYIEPTVELRSAAGLLSALCKNRITHIDIPPALLGVLKSAEMPSSLQTIVIGGEVCPAAVVRSWAKRFRVVNVYGPTEATVCTSLCRCGSQWKRPIIGSPLPGVRYLIVSDNAPAQPGTPGELYILGPALARGYLNLPQLNSAKFVQWQGERAYRSGDLVVERDGEIEFLGRIDRQFKLHGQLIEPAEVERRLSEHPAVKQALVFKRTLDDARTAGSSVLAAVVVPTGDRSPTVSELRSYLAGRLPGWMIPATFEYRAALPLTINGKLDLTQIAQKSRKKPLRRSLKTTAVERLLALLHEITGFSEIDSDAALSEQGLDSLMLIEFMAAADRQGLPLTAAQLCEGASLRQIAAVIEGEAEDICYAMHSTELERDAALTADEIAMIARASAQPLPDKSELESGPILLTGATGFFGARLLLEMLSRTEASLYCLVRAESEVQGKLKIKSALSFHGYSLSEAELARIKPVCGDLSQPGLGLSRELWLQLASRIRSVYHCGAEVNLLRSYPVLKAVNLEGTRAVLDFVYSGTPKILNYASTLSVFVGSEKNRGTLYENDQLQDSGRVFGGYAQSKWAAEKLLLNARAGGLRGINIYRLGLICGDSQYGRMKSSDLLVELIKELSRTGFAPSGNEYNLKVDITPVDYAAKALLHIALQGAAGEGETYHIANKNPLSLCGLVDSLRRFGKPLKWVPESEWLQRIEESRRTEDGGFGRALLALCRSRGCERSYAYHREFDLFQATDTVFEMSNTDRMLVGSGLLCPAADEELLSRYLAQIII